MPLNKFLSPLKSRINGDMQVTMTSTSTTDDNVHNVHNVSVTTLHQSAPNETNANIIKATVACKKGNNNKKGDENPPAPSRSRAKQPGTVSKGKRKIGPAEVAVVDKSCWKDDEIENAADDNDVGGGDRVESHKKKQATSYMCSTQSDANNASGCIPFRYSVVGDAVATQQTKSNDNNKENRAVQPSFVAVAAAASLVRFTRPRTVSVSAAAPLPPPSLHQQLNSQKQLSLPSPAGAVERCGSMSAAIVGVKFYEGGRLVTRLNCRLHCVREPENTVDTNAIAVYFPLPNGKDEKIGHLPSATAQRLAKLLDCGRVMCATAFNTEIYTPGKASIAINLRLDFPMCVGDDENTSAEWKWLQAKMCPRNVSEAPSLPLSHPLPQPPKKEDMNAIGSLLKSMVFPIKDVVVPSFASLLARTKIQTQPIVFSPVSVFDDSNKYHPTAHKKTESMTPEHYEEIVVDTQADENQREYLLAKMADSMKVVLAHHCRDEARPPRNQTFCGFELRVLPHHSWTRMDCLRSHLFLPVLDVAVLQCL